MLDMKAAHFGSWKSPITTDLIVSGGASFTGLTIDGDDIYWIEMRPSEGGRNVIVRRSYDGSVNDVTPPGYNARNSVHEYGGGAFSGKDPSKVDRSAAYMGRYVAKNIVAAGLATRCEIQFAYAIGYPKPVSVHVDTFGTNTVSDAKILRAVNRVFSFKPADIVSSLKLLKPIYSQTTNYGHFGKNHKDITWEKTGLKRFESFIQRINLGLNRLKPFSRTL